MKYILFFFFFLFQHSVYSQTVIIDDVPISIDDSLEQVISKFQKPGYHLIVDTLKLSIRYTIFKEVFNLNDNSDKSLRIICYLHFFYIPQEIPFHYTKALYKIDKVWSNIYSDEIPDVLNIINNIIEKNTIDKYSIELFQNKNIEPEYSSKTITIELKQLRSF